jgi:hypothetical protein
MITRLILVLFTLRIYALCGRSKIVICMASAMIFVRLGYDSWVSSCRLLLAQETVR